MKERDKLQRELNKARKELEKAKAETEKAKETEKVKKKKLPDKGAIPPEPTRVSTTLDEKLAQNEQLYETLRNENDVSGYNHLTNACMVVMCPMRKCIRKAYESGLIKGKFKC